MSTDAISPVATQRLDTVVVDPVSGESRRRTDYAGTVWYGGRPQITGRIRVSQGSTAQITTPFWLPDSHVYAAAAAGDAVVQASAAVQSVVEHCEILEVQAALGEDPRNRGALLVFLSVSAVARLPLGVAYRVTVICSAGAVQSPTV